MFLYVLLIIVICLAIIRKRGKEDVYKRQAVWLGIILRLGFSGHRLPESIKELRRLKDTFKF